MTSFAHQNGDFGVYRYILLQSNIHVENPLFANNLPNEKPWMVAKACTSWLMVYFNAIPLVTNRFCKYWNLWETLIPIPTIVPTLMDYVTVTSVSSFQSFPVQRCSGAAPRSHGRFHRRWHCQAEPNALPAPSVGWFSRNRKVMILPPKSWGFLGFVSSKCVQKLGKHGWAGAWWFLLICSSKQHQFRWTRTTFDRWFSKFETGHFQSKLVLFWWF